MDFYVRQLKRREITQGCAFWGSERCPANFFGVKPPKTEILGARIGLSSLNDKKFKSLLLENFLADHDEIFTGSTHHEYAFVGGPMAPSTNPRWRRPPSLISGKCPNFMGRCITVMQRWSRDQKSKPKVNSRDVIKWRSEGYKCVDLSDYNRYLNQIWYRAQIPHYQHTGMAKFT